ncbi:melanocyte-stimulating hormone receptor-like [Oculina patagonica]
MNKTHQTCSFLDINLNQTGETQTTNILTCVLNSVFSLITCLGNSVILYVIWKTRELHSPSFILLFCLAASDLLVGLICQPFFVAYKIAELENNFGVYCVLRMIHTISGWTTSGVSMATLTLIPVDQLFALTLHLRYTTIVTVPRVFQITVCLWIASITVVMLRFSLTNWIIIPVVLLLLTFLITVVSTFYIFQIVRRHRRQISQQQWSVQSNTVNVLKCRKSAVTVLYVYGLFLIFYLPVCVTMFVDSFLGYTLTVKIAYDYASTVVFINSFLNPLVYCWRIGEIRRAVRNALRKNYLDNTHVIRQ